MRLPARWLVSSVGSLTQRTLRAGIWLVIGDGANRLSGFVRLVILARVLAPADFGLMGIALVVTRWVEEFSELGFKDALIQKTGDVRPYLDTAWTAQILRAFGIAAVLVAGAPLAGWFFAEPLAVRLIQALAVESIIRGFSNPAMILLRKELDIRREVVWRVSSASAALIVSVPLAFLLRNVWALVLSLIAVSVVETCVSYLVTPYRPRLRLSWPQLRELRSFGRWVFWFRVTNFLSSNLDSIAVGRMLGVSALGNYQMGYQLAFVPTSTVGLHAHAIMFPAFSKVERPEDLGRALLRTLGALSAVMLPLGVFFTVFGDQIVRLALGDRWLSVVPILVLLAWAGIIQAHGLILNALLMARARLNVDVWTGVVKTLVLAALLYPSVTYAGTVGVAAAIAITALAAVVFRVLVVTRMIHLRATDIVRGLRTGVLGSIPLSLSALVVSPGLSLRVGLVAAGALAASAAIIAAPLRAYVTGRARSDSSPR